ncbi:homeobox domain-containing protein, partial [Chlamydoabsidia padenii]
DPSRKRTRATAEQLAVLEDTFSVNVSPNSKLRKQLADQLKMTDRSIQIWFQNRRAKVKHMQKRAQLQMHQASMRAQLYHYQQQHYYLQQHYAPHQRAHSLDSVPPPSLLPYADMVDLNPDPWNFSVSPTNSTAIDPNNLLINSFNLGLSISSLAIGRWHRLKMQPKDLECVYQPERQLLCWNIVDGQHCFKMEIPVTSIRQMTYTCPSSLSAHQPTSSCLYEPNHEPLLTSSPLSPSPSLLSSSTTSSPCTSSSMLMAMMGELHLDLYHAPLFYMKHQHEWVSCIDFTEHQQASQVLHHTLKGMALALWQEI